ncbi:MBL fold metallo-hydrolase [Hymenobacter arizonensis]|uniref:L-ascorbate metabolism protein UlaG, beta-lactamase superfamily n=1 Tax=Hymenobacter arizonensis TaxID=1227077 RepID=A0A1I6AJA7_HYMAR|nr:MBL fold metallo-hydrolase [Hymenobacter arizonensis]SFQ68794.1 L-ascorbate metabolism protein UlaG, beta-lactamase superfamily [Hymenobacter arizonensis]
MILQLIRHSTLRLDYAGVKFLVDPMLAEQGAYPGLPGSPNSHLTNPTVGLPVPAENLGQVDAVVVTHTHFDHWDEAAVAQLPKHLPVFTQHAQDQALIQSQGFTDVRLIQGATFNGVSLTQTPGQHGSDAVMAVAGELLGQVCGVVFQHPEEKTLYLAGDTVWNPDVENNLRQYQPQVVVLNAGDNQITGVGSIVMNQEDVLAVHQAAPQATLISTHMESTNHATLSRQQLRAFATEKGIADHLLVPADGEAYTF